MAKNTGTLITSAIRPNDSLDQISVALANEIQGGLHSYASFSSLSTIIQARRQWGMKVVIYNDGANNGTYLLKYEWASTNIMDDNNWVLDSNSGGNGSSEWIDSVISVSDGNSPTTNDGDRYLVGTPSYGIFATQSNKIAYYSSSLNSGSGGWAYSIPTNGQTLRADNEPNVIYKYQGTWSSGVWVKEYLNQIRYIYPTSVDGLTYSYTTVGQTPLDAYSFSQYESVFSMTNSGTVSLSIDGLEYVEVKKLSSNQLVTLSPNDIVPNVNYTLVYNNGIFQANIQSTTGVIGPAEDGDYTDGLYTDLTDATPIGTPIDRFNEVLKALVPPPAPNLSSWGSNRTGISAKLSFNSTTTPTFSSATQSPYGGVDVNGTFSPSAFRLGVFSASGTLTGTISSGVSVHPSVPTPAYAAFSFGQATTGTMSLFLNGTTVSSISLATQSAINTTGGLTGGIILSAPTSSKFPSGTPFEQFQNRTGTWQISLTNSGLLDGYNWVDLRHDIPSSFTVSRFEFVLDRGATVGVSFSVAGLGIPNWAAATKYLSGIAYYTSTSSELNYQCSLDNLYLNTYNTSPTALTVRDTSGIWGFGGTSTYQFPIPFLASAEPGTSLPISVTFSILPNRRRLNESITFSCTGTKASGQQFTGGTSSLSNLFIDTFGTSSTTLLYEDFSGEDYRLKNGGSYSNSYDLVSGVTSSSNVWVSSQSLVLNDGLMVGNGRLMYPTGDYSGSNPTNPNYTNIPTTAANFWSTTDPVSKYRVYTRWFRFTGESKSTMIISITSSNSLSFVKVGNTLGATAAYLECKLPLSSGKTGVTSSIPNTTNPSTQVTGWMDCSQVAINGRYGNTDGCWDQSFTYIVPSTNTTRMITFGTSGGTEKSGGYVLIRLTLPQNSTINITSIQLS